MDKRTILAVVLSAAVMYIYSMFPASEKPQSAKQEPQKAVVSATADSKSQPPVTQAAVESSAAVTFVDKQEVKVETELFTALFSPRGASLKSLTLKKYNEDLSASPKPVVLGENSDPGVYNFSTQASGFNLPASAIYTSNTSSINLKGKENKQLIFNYISNQGFTIRKTYTISGDTYE